MALAREYAAALQCPRLHLMAGLLAPSVDHAVAWANYVANLRWAAQQAAQQVVAVLVEPLNARDAPGYLLNRQQRAHDLVAEVAAPNVLVLFDLCHCQISEGDVATSCASTCPPGMSAICRWPVCPSATSPT